VTVEAIETERLTLRNFCPEDWRDLHEIIVGYQATEYAQYDDQWPTGEDGIQKITAWFAGGDSYLAVCLRDTGKVIGLIALDERSESDESDGPARNLGYIFDPRCHGQGYATEACRAAITYVFEALGEARFVTGTHDANLPSRRLLARLGFRALGGSQYVLEREAWLAQRDAAP
jgi:ribosomal-protein-alanine N-acetyltransferase